MLRLFCLAVVTAWVAGAPARVVASPFADPSDWQFPALAPVVRDAWVSARLLGEDTETSPTMRLAFEKKLAAAFEAGAVADDPATVNDEALADEQLGYALLTAEALANVRYDLAPEVREHWRARAQALVATGGRKWGAEALTMTALNPDARLSRAQYLDWLFAQYASDNVPGNGFAASQVGLLGVDAAPELIVPDVIAAWRAWDRPDRELDHRMLRVAQLAMAHAVGSPTGDVEGISTINAYDAMSPRDQETMRAIAVKSLTTLSGWDDDALDRELLHSLVRPMAFHLLTTIQPRPWDELLEVANDENAYRSQRDFIWLRVIGEAPSLLLAPDRADLPATMVVRSTHTHWKLQNLLAAPEPATDNMVEQDNGCGEDDEVDSSNEQAAWFREHRDAVLARVAARIDNPPADRWGQCDDLQILSFLLRTRYEPMRAEVLHRLVAHLASDGWWGNRSESIGMLIYGAGGLNDDERLMVRSGLRVAAKEGDAEMVGACVSVLRETEPAYSLTEEPEVIVWMLEELMDDDEYGNGAQAYAVLRDGLPDAANSQLLKAIAADEDADPQQRHAARQLIGGSYWLGDYEQIEWELRQAAMQDAEAEAEEDEQEP